MSIFDENCSVLERMHIGAAEKLKGAPQGTGTLEILDTPTGDPTVVRDGLTVHSRRDPRRESRASVDAGVPPAATAALVLGFGLGYAVDALRVKFPDLPILVLEPDAEMFRAALKVRDLRAMLSDQHIHFLVASPPEDVSTLLPSLPLGSPAFLRLRPAVQRDPGWFQAAEEIIRSWLLRREINTNTLNRFGRLWVRNLVHNLRIFAEAPGISRLEGMFTGVPALVLAGGPSLDSVLPFLPALSQRMLVIAVNTPLKRCREAGVEPDFTVVVDPQYWASRFMDWAWPGRQQQAGGGPGVHGRGILIAEPSTHPHVFRNPASPVYLCSSLFPLGEKLEEAVGAKGKLGAGGSVSTAAWDLARLLGASPIYAAGLDLGYPGMRTHCRGVFTEDLWLASSGRLAPLEGSSFRYLREIGLFTVRSSGGGAALTDRRMLIYKWWFENQLAMRPQLSAFTLSEHGVAVQGMPLAPLETLLQLPVIRAQIDAALDHEAESRRADPSASGRSSALREALQDLRNRLDELSGLAEKAHDVNAALRAAVRAGRDTAALVAELDSLDEKVLEISERSIAGFLVQSMIQRITARGAQTTSAEDTLADGDALYHGIMESARWQRDLVDGSLSLMARPERKSAQGSARSADLFK